MLGKTRQAYYQKSKYIYNEHVRNDILLEMVNTIRLERPRVGTRKLIQEISDLLPLDMVMGQDRFFALLKSEGLLVRRRKSKAVSTNSRHWLRKYPNLIKNFVPDKPHQLPVNDITY